MAVAKQQFIEGDSIPVFRVFEWSKTQLAKCDELYHKRKKEVITLTAEKLESKGFPCEKICSEISKQLADYVDDAYVREVLPSKYKNEKQSNNANIGVENRAKKAVQHMIAEEYDIDKIHSYSKDYLIEIVKYLHQTLELNCQNTNKRMEQELEH